MCSAKNVANGAAFHNRDLIGVPMKQILGDRTLPKLVREKTKQPRCYSPVPRHVRNLSLIYLAVIHNGQLSSENIAVDLEAAREVSVRVAFLR